MVVGMAQLKRLRGKSLEELRVRGRQTLSRVGERVFRLSEGEMSDQALLRHLKPAPGVTAAEAAKQIVDRIRGSIASQSGRAFPSLQYREEIVSIMRDRFKSESRDIIDRADRAVAGRFDLLGFKDLSFGDPPDWLLEPISGKRAPLDHWSAIDYLESAAVGDKKITWELNRHQHFVTLGQAYWLTGDERYAEAFVNQVTSWMDANPPKRGINWVSSLELSLRSISWIWALYLFAESPRLTAQFELRLLKCLLAHGLHLHKYLSHYFSPNTHLTGEALGLVYLGTTLEEFRGAESWKKLGLEILLNELHRQVRNDGVYFEQATYYHRYTADFYTHLLILDRAGGVCLPAQVEEKLGSMISHLMWIMRPDGSSPLIGDDDGGRLITLGARPADDFRDTLATAAVLFGRGDWKRAAGDVPVETLWLLGPVGLKRYDSQQSAEPPTQSRIYRDSGIAVMRDGWSKDSSYTLMDCGPHGSLSYGHAHADALSIEFAALGKVWLVDPGTLTYTGDRRLRDWFRSTHAHNTVTVDGESQSISAGPFSWKHIAKTTLVDFIDGDGFDYVEASHDGYRRLSNPVIHTRLVVNPRRNPSEDYADSLGSYLIVRDSFAASGTHSYAIRYHLTPGCLAFGIGNQVTVTEPGGRRLHITCLGQSRVVATITEAWVSRVYGHREPSLVIVFESTATGPQDFTSFIIPALEGGSIGADRHPVNSVAASGFQVTSHSTRDLILVNDNGGPSTCGPLTGACRFAWARFENDSFVRGFFIRGHRFETSDGLAFRAAAPVSHCSLWRNANRVYGSVSGASHFDHVVGGYDSRDAIDGTAYQVSQRVQRFPAREAIT